MLPCASPRDALRIHQGAGQLLCCGCLKRRYPESAPTRSQQRMLTSVFLMLLTPVAVTVSLGACHAVALSTSFHATVRLMAITVLEALRQYLFSSSG